MSVYFFSILFCGLASLANAAPMPFPPGIPLTTATVRVAVSHDPVKSIFRYAYTILNSSRSVGLIGSYYLDISTSHGGIILNSDGLINSATGYSGMGANTRSGEVEDATVPVGFESSPAGWSSGPSVELTAGWYGDPFIDPGQSLGSFVITSHGVPGIRRFTVEPSYDPDDFIEGNIDEADSEDEAQAIVDLDHAIQRAIRFQGVTIGPVQPPSLTDVGMLIDRLIALKHQVASLGWLGNAKFVLKLDKRLDQAKAALARDKKKLARTRLTQFVHELTKAHDEHEGEHGDKRDDDQRKNKDDDRNKKFVNNEAFQLLKLNAEFIIAKLPAKAKDKDEEDESRRAEAEKDDDRDDDKNKGGMSGKGGKGD